MILSASELDQIAAGGANLRQRSNSPRVLRQMRELLDADPHRRPWKNWLMMMGAILAALLVVFSMQSTS